MRLSGVRRSRPDMCMAIQSSGDRDWHPRFDTSPGDSLLLQSNCIPNIVKHVRRHPMRLSQCPRFIGHAPHSQCIPFRLIGPAQLRDAALIIGDQFCIGFCAALLGFFALFRSANFSRRLVVPSLSAALYRLPLGFRLACVSKGKYRLAARQIE